MSKFRTKEQQKEFNNLIDEFDIDWFELLGKRRIISREISPILHKYRRELANCAYEWATEMYFMKIGEISDLKKISILENKKVQIVGEIRKLLEQLGE